MTNDAIKYLLHTFIYFLEVVTNNSGGNVADIHVHMYIYSKRVLDNIIITGSIYNVTL